MTDLPAADFLRLYLGWGKKQAHTIGLLAQMTNLSRRETEAAVEALRMDGVPVCTGNAGVWLSGDQAELRGQIEARTSRAKTILRGNRGLKQAIAALERVEQLPLFAA